MQYRLNIEGQEAPEKGLFVILTKVDVREIKYGIRKTKVVGSINDIGYICIRDYLPNPWPDRIDVTWKNAQGETVVGTLIRLRGEFD